MLVKSFCYSDSYFCNLLFAFVKLSFSQNRVQNYNSYPISLLYCSIFLYEFNKC